MPGNLKSVYLEYLRCHEVACSDDSVQTLKKYCEESLPPLSKRPLPEAERAYRQAVVQQQQTAVFASKWYDKVFSEVLEHHQQKAEAVKGLIQEVITNQSCFASRLSSSGSIALHDIALFQSSYYIAPRHEEMNQEKGHRLLKETCYHSYVIDGKVVEPLFGTGIIRAVALAQGILDTLKSARLHPFTHSLPDPIDLFQLEKDIYDSGIATMQQSHGKLWRILERTLMAVPPLLPFTDEEVSLYSKGISRKSMEILLKTRVPIARKAVMHLLRSFINYACQIGIVGLDVHWFLTGNRATAVIVDDLWRKWDVDEDCPFPSGVNRVWGRDFRRSKVVWKKTGEEYGRQPAHD